MITVDELAKIPLFSALAIEELEYLGRTVADIHLIPGEYAAYEGETRALFVIIEGRVELTKVVHGVERVIAIRLPGELSGEIPMTLSTPAATSLRATEPSRVLKLSVKVFYTLVAMAPQIFAAVSAAALERMEMLRKAAAQPLAPAMRIVGPRLDPQVHDIKSFLHRNQIPFIYMTPDNPALAASTGEGSDVSGPYPVVLLPNGGRLVAPTMRDIAKAGGLPVAPSREDYDLVIVGGGPAGLTAAVNGASEGLRTLLIEYFAPGGQAGASSRIENYLGFPFGVSGDELASRALQQANRLGAEIIVTRRVDRIDPATLAVTLDGGELLNTKAIILATGVQWRRIANASFDHLVGCGVYYGAERSDAPLAQGKDIYLIGAGNSAGQASIFFANHARSVTLIVRADTLARCMSQYLIEQIATKSNIRVETHSEVVAVHGGEWLETIEVVDRRTGDKTSREAAALFVLIGANAATDWLPAEIARDAHGYILTGTDAAMTGRWDSPPFMLETSVPGIFAVGDVRSGSVKRVAAGVGEGGMAIALVHKRLQQ
jgi:thioredoxin reductase (NADPH)